MRGSAPFRHPSPRARRSWAGVAIATLAVLAATLVPASAFASTPTASISGTVSGADSAGAGLANVGVALTLPGGTAVASTATDDSGAYSFTGLAAASYLVQFQPNFGTDYLTQWWKNASTAPTATPVVVAAGASISGINAVLPLGGIVSGTVTLSTGPLPAFSSVQVALIPTDPSQALSVSNTSTASDGTFSFVGVAAGSYTVSYTAPYGTNFASQWWSGASSLATATSFTVSAGSTVSGRDAVLQPGSTVSGTVTSGPGGTPLSFASVQAVAPDGTVVAGSTTASDGTYTITGLPAGSVTLEFSPPFLGNFVTQWWSGATSQSAASYLDVAANSSLTGYDAQLSVGATISGTILDSTGNPIPYADASVLKAGDVFATQAFADASGAYTIPGLTAGDYTVSFDGSSAGNYAAGWWNGASSPATATVIHLADQQQLSGIDAHLGAGASISGSVSGLTSAGVAFPAQNATVYVIRADGSEASEAYVDNSGSYSIANLPAGTYALRIEPQGDTTDFASQWYRNASSQATATPVTLTAGQALTGVNVTLASASAPASLTTATPKILGVAKVDHFLIVNPGHWGPGRVSLSYQWFRSGAPIAGAKSLVYRVTQADAGATLTVAVTGAKTGYASATVTSAATAVVTGGRLHTAIPTVSGTPRVGSTLTASAGNWGPGTVSLTFRWYRGHSSISGATSSKYTVVPADRGATLTVVVTGTKPGFTTESVASSGVGIPR